MFDRLRTETLNWILIISLILFVIELLFFKSGLIITAVVMVGLGYYGKKYYYSSVGKLLFWIAVISMIVIILNMTVVRFLLLVFLILFVMDYYKTKGTVYLQPQHAYQDVTLEETLIKKTPLFRHLFYGDQQTKETAYTWRDINIFGGFGERKIDLSHAILEDDTAIVTIRHGIGNITIYIPYDVEFSIVHSAIFGRAYILQQQHAEIFYQQLNYQTKYYTEAGTRVKIVTSLISGNIEVKRI
ncbi:MAG TPA: cell wall-active antibiotics response protein LiaF [Pseudogracilibacillus sp.]|nr:cell wall-active antibiotics response protein LiaF [Pseudogracilibacillus sp.]